MSYPTLTERKAAKVAAMSAAVNVLCADLAEYARQHDGRFILFGSAARGELQDDSDVDLIVDFPPDLDQEACDFAEVRACRLKLKPDIHLLAWAGARLRHRIADEGRVLTVGTALPSHRETHKETWPLRDARWTDVRADADAASRHFRAAARVFSSDELAAWNDLDRLMALLHYMQSAHISVEAALLRVLAILDEAPPSGAEWHKQLIVRCSSPMPGRRPAILPADLARDAQETRSFRHLAMHNYDITFERDKARRAVEAGSRLADELPGQLDAFSVQVDR